MSEKKREPFNLAEVLQNTATEAEKESLAASVRADAFRSIANFMKEKDIQCTAPAKEIKEDEEKSEG